MPVDPARSSRRGAAITDISLDGDSFWGRRQTTNADATLAHCLEWMERLGWLENFDRIARGEVTIARAGWQFSDSEIYKLLEAMAWELARRPDDVLARTYDDLVERVAAAQDDDGYLSTAFGHPGLDDRYTDLAMGHELYNIGHLLQAAVARMRTSGPHALVEVARRAADHVCREFGADGRAGICGHPEIEVALAEFGRALGDDRYVEQARLFIDRRGHGSLPVRPLLSAEYFQDDTPVRDADALRGHAVRALYLSAGAVDVAVDGEDRDLLNALERQWARTVERRTYLTGGMGSRHQDEGFGDDWELPADRAYCETCAGVASVMFSWRLFLATGDVVYADLIERTMYNIVATSPSVDGRAFFYANPLQQREPGSTPRAGVNTRAEGGVRAPWFEVSCCPTNIARTMASLPAYFAAVGGDALEVLQYAPGEIRLGGFVLRVETRYPDDGRIRLTVIDAPEGMRTLRLRVPAWARTADVAVSGSAATPVAPGWAEVTRAFTSGDTVDLDLDVTARFTWPDDRIDAVRGTVAVERGPLVLCAESTDLPTGVRLEDVRIDASAALTSDGDGARVAATAIARAASAPSAVPYGARTDAAPGRSFDLTLIPYHRWAERGPSIMRVFLPVATAVR
ncbi:glycoside hydrolase family 127 protein [Microbacterium rhizomatis]|uniref:Glycoside hydrolase family 127 protein n=1 Tax=Microbacterium rhizomatis TaxID=1631477 RepID=A0A5J5J647_9MICO|nr:glycoside hydrolase family 127 protein [Microbacterium rhizomatis]